MSCLDSRIIMTLSSNEPTTTAIYTLSLHDALPILQQGPTVVGEQQVEEQLPRRAAGPLGPGGDRRLRRRLVVGRVAQLERALHRSEEHTSELQSRENLVCRLLLEKKKNISGPT